MYPVNLVGCIRVNIPKAADTVKSDWFLMHGPCQLCRLYQGECWGEKVPTHTSLKQRIHFFSLRQELVCVQEKDLTHTLHMAQSSKLLMHFLLPQIGYRYLHWKCVWEREREKYRHRQAQRMHPPTPPTPACYTCLHWWFCVYTVCAVSRCVCTGRGRWQSNTYSFDSLHHIMGSVSTPHSIGPREHKVGAHCLPSLKDKYKHP